MDKVTFRCIRSGNLVTFTNADDIAGLRKHEGYVEVKPDEVKVAHAPVQRRTRKLQLGLTGLV